MNKKKPLKKNSGSFSTKEENNTPMNSAYEIALTFNNIVNKSK